MNLSFPGLSAILIFVPVKLYIWSLPSVGKQSLATTVSTTALSSDKEPHTYMLLSSKYRSSGPEVRIKGILNGAVLSIAFSPVRFFDFIIPSK